MRIKDCLVQLAILDEPVRIEGEWVGIDIRVVQNVPDGSKVSMCNDQHSTMQSAI